MGVVYRARDENLDRDVAIKILPPGSLEDEDKRRRFKQEAKALARLNHPSIATIYDFGCEGTTDYLVMELLTGPNLADKLRPGPLPQPLATSFAIQIADGLYAAHQQEILHRDLKPANVGLTTENRVKILDFGLAKLLKSDPLEATRSMTTPGLAKGTLAYMSPEQLRGGTIDARSDIYSAGATLYEMIVGRPPHVQLSEALLVNAVLNERPTPPSKLNRTVSPALEAIILKAMDKDPDQRYGSARELAQDLERLNTSAVTVAGHLALRRRLRRRLVGAAVVAGIIVVGLVLWQLVRRLQFRPATGQRPLLLVGGFENHTGESVFDDTLRELFIATLEQSRVVEIFPSSRLADVLERMGRPPTQRIDENTGREICQREGLQGLLLGSIARLGHSYVLVARIVGPAGSSIITAEASSASADELPARVDEIAETLRRRFGESLQSLKANSAPLAKVSSSYLDAVRYFTLGKQSLYNGEASQAILMFGKSLEVDPNFAVAHEYLADSYQQLNQYERSDEQIRQAALLADRVSEPERLRIMAAYYSLQLDFGKECENYQILAELEPQDPAPYVNLGVCRKEMFDYAGAVSATEKALQFVPRSDVRVNLAAQLVAKGDPEQALQVAQPFRREFPNDLFARTVMGRIYVALGRLHDARQTFQGMVEAGGDSEIEGELSLADLALASGRHREAEENLQAAIAASDKTRNRVYAAKARIALAEMRLQRSPSASGPILAQVDLPPHAPALHLLLGRTYAWSGRLDAAQKNLRAIDALVQQHDVPALEALRYLLQAEILMARRKFPEATSAAEKAATDHNSVFAVETLARCYAVAGMDAKAVRQYEILLTRANELMDDTHVESFDEPAFRRAVEARYRLALLYRKLRRSYEARTQVQQFLSYWSEADRELGMYRDAQQLLESLSAAGIPTPAR